MKKLRIITAFVFLLSLLGAPQIAFAGERPALKSFSFSPHEIELTSLNNSIFIELAVTHPNGISNSNVQVTLSDGINNSISTHLYRTDNPENSKLTTVVFKGNIQIPRVVNAGAYFFSLSDITNGSSAGYSYKLENFSAPDVRTLIGAENALIVRDNGKLNLDYKTFEGPAYETLTTHQFINGTKYNSANSPMYKVGESYDPSIYFETYVPSLPLKMTTATPMICTTDGKTMKFIAQGNCGFAVLTEGNNDYKERKYVESVTIGSARIKQTLTINQVATQDSTGLPKSMRLDQIYSSNGGVVFPNSVTQEVCLATGTYVKIFSGGTCELEYVAPGNTTYLPSDVYVQVIEISRSTQTLSFEVPTTARVGSKGLTLNAVASSSGAITYSATPSNVCAISGSTLDFKGKGTCQVTATQAGTTTIAPVSVTKSIAVSPASIVKKTITCVKGGKKIKTTASKCPKGYKKK